jgi:DNA-binding MarR family transcriptional regulator
MGDDLQARAEALITTSARIVGWAPTMSTFSLSLAGARILARLNDHSRTRITDLAVAEGSSQPTITDHIKRLEATGLVQHSPDARDALGIRTAALTCLEPEREPPGVRSGHPCLS